MMNRIKQKAGKLGKKASPWSRKPMVETKRAKELYEKNNRDRLGS